jgi:hypothetical protein
MSMTYKKLNYRRRYILASRLWNKVKSMRTPLVLRDWKSAIAPIETEGWHSGFFSYYTQEHRYPLGGRPWRQ